jgi:YbgC/YbaW family acyl-CoA thioester hydrolase
MPKPFIIEEYVRWSDVDFAGIIFYGSYVRFFELAETELFRAAGLPFGTVFGQYDVFLPRAQVHTEFHFPPRLDDHLAVAAYIGRVGRSSMTIEFEVVRRPDGTHCADGHMVLVAVDRAGLKPRPLPPEFIAQLKPFTLSRAEARRQLGIVERLA